MINRRMALMRDLKHRVRGLDHLRAGLVGLLELQHLGGFLIEVDAGDVVACIGRRLVDRLLRGRIGLRLLRQHARRAHQVVGSVVQ